MLLWQHQAPGMSSSCGTSRVALQAFQDAELLYWRVPAQRALRCRCSRMPSCCTTACMDRTSAPQGSVRSCWWTWLATAQRWQKQNTGAD